MYGTSFLIIKHTWISACFLQSSKWLFTFVAGFCWGSAVGAYTGGVYICGESRPAPPCLKCCALESERAAAVFRICGAAQEGEKFSTHHNCSANISSCGLCDWEQRHAGGWGHTLNIYIYMSWFHSLSSWELSKFERKCTYVIKFGNSCSDYTTIIEKLYKHIKTKVFI